MERISPRDYFAGITPARQEESMPKTKHANAQTNGSALEWNVMVYMSSDNDLGSECVWALTEMQNSNLSDRIAVLAQFDPPTRGIGTKRYDFTGGIPAQRQRVEALAKKVATASKSAQGKKSINSHQVNLLANVALEEEFDSHLEDFEVENLADAVEERPALSELAPRTSNHSEDNFADPKVLAEFVEKGIERYPAKHYLVILSGYGSSPTEGLLTESNPVGSMKLDDLKKALEKVQQNHLRFLKEDPKGEIDILGLDACLMGMAEVVSQLTGTVRYLVASEGLAPATGWPYRRILEAMSKNPTAAPVDVAKIIMKSYIRYYSDYFISGISVDQSINDLSKAGQLESAVKALVETLTRPLNGRSQNGALRLNKSVVDDIVLAHWKAQTYRFD
ncbi:MAG TPA: clostripain-related cysteine peptidase, partial [Blastocatellia bacterium]|nr:clostripain-related cysteine peptidase [Blastocatellia bacterium]